MNIHNSTVNDKEFVIFLMIILALKRKVNCPSIANYRAEDIYMKTFYPK